MANTVYHAFLFRQMGNGTIINFGADSFKVSLHTSTYVPNAAAHAFFSDLTNEIAVAGYTAGGQALAGQSIGLSGGRGKFDANDLSWTANITGARWAVLYKDTGVASTSPLVCAIDFGADRDHTGGTFTITWHADGILYIKQGT